MERPGESDGAGLQIEHQSCDVGGGDVQNTYEMAHSFNPQLFQPIAGLGIVHRNRGDDDADIQAYERALEMDGNCAQASSSMMTMALKRHGDSTVLEYARNVYDLDKPDPVIVPTLAVAYHDNDYPGNRDKFTRVANNWAMPITRFSTQSTLVK